jgi:hypothetical protein
MDVFFSMHLASFYRHLVLFSAVTTNSEAVTGSILMVLNERIMIAMKPS